MKSELCLHRLVYGSDGRSNRLRFWALVALPWALMLMEAHDLAVASEQLHFKSNWHGPGLEVAGDGVVQPPDTRSWKQTLSLPLVCFSLLFCFFSSGYPRSLSCPGALWGACEDGREAETMTISDLTSYTVSTLFLFWFQFNRDIRSFTSGAKDALTLVYTAQF